MGKLPQEDSTGFIRVGSEVGRPLAQEVSERGGLDGGSPGRSEKEQRRRKQGALTEMLPELNYQSGEGPWRLPTLISFSEQAFGLLLTPTTQSPESYRLLTEAALGRHGRHRQLELRAAHAGCGLGGAYMCWWSRGKSLTGFCPGRQSGGAESQGSGQGRSVSVLCRCIPVSCSGPRSQKAPAL